MNLRFSEQRLKTAGPMLALLVVLALAGFYFTTRYAALVGGDTFTYLKYARLLAKGQVAISGPLQSLMIEHRIGDNSLYTPVWNTMMLPDGRWVFTVAPGYPLFLAGVLRLGGQWALLHANIILLLAALAAFYLALTQALRGRAWANIAALAGMSLLLGLNIPTQHQFVQLWREPLTFLLLLVPAVAFLALDRHPRLYWPIPLLLGFSCAVKESNVLYAGWMGIALLFHPAFRARRDLGRAIGGGVLLFLLGCAPLLLQNWSFTGRPWTSIYVLRETSQFSVTEPGAGLSAGNFMETLSRYVRMYRPYAGIVIPLLLLAGWGAWRNRKAPAVLLMGGWLALHAGLYLQWGNADFRHMYFANFPVVFLAVLGFQELVVRRLSPPWIQGSVWVVVLVSALAAIIAHQPARPVYRARDWLALTRRLAANIDPTGVVLVNRPLRDLLGGYTDLGIIRFHELMDATGREPADLARRIASGGIPVYFLDSPDRDPASVENRRDLAAMDWKYLLQGCDPEQLAEFKIEGRRMVRYLGQPLIRLYRLRPWSRTEDRAQLAVPPGGAAFLTLDPKGLEADLEIELNGAPVRHDLRSGVAIPLTGREEKIEVIARRKSGGPLPRVLNWRAVSWEEPLILPAGRDAQPDDRALFGEIPEFQPIQYRRRFPDAMTLNVPVREGTDLFTLAQVEVPNTRMEGGRLRARTDRGLEMEAPIQRESLWISLSDAQDASRQVGYRMLQVFLPSNSHLSVAQVISHAAWIRWRAHPEQGGECGLLVAGGLAPVPGATGWLYLEDEQKIQAGAGIEANPRVNPFASYLPPDRLAVAPTLRWEGAGLTDLRVLPVHRRFNLPPNDPLLRAVGCGFHPTEWGDTGTFCWTAPRGEMQLPVAAPGQGYRLRLKLAAGNPAGSNRVDVICGSWQARIWVDGIPRTNEWVLPGETFTDRWAKVCIDVEPWSPADTGSRDHRTLGVRWYGTEWEAIPPGGAP